MRMITAGGKLYDISDWDVIPLHLSTGVTANIKRKWLVDKVLTFRIMEMVYTFKNGDLIFQSEYSPFVWNPQEIIGYYVDKDRYVPIHWEKIGV